MGIRREPWREIDRVARSLLRGHTASANIPVLAVRTADGLRLAFDLPGVDPATIDLTVRPDAVTVHAKRRTELWEPAEGEADDNRVLIDERGPVELRREVHFDDGLVPDGARATYRDGVLTVTLAIQADVEGHRVEVTLVDDESVGVDAHLGAEAIGGGHEGTEEGPGPLAPPPPEGQQANPLPTS